MLMLPLVVPHELMSESGETWLTVAGALILCMAHVVNFRLCTAEQAWKNAHKRLVKSERACRLKGVSSSEYS